MGVLFDVLVFQKHLKFCFLVYNVFLYILAYNNTMKHIFILLPIKYIKKALNSKQLNKFT